MWILLAIIALLIILFVALVCSKITITVWFIKHNKNEHAVMDVRCLYGWMFLHYEMPGFVLQNLRKGILVRLEKSSSQNEGSATDQITRVNKRKVEKWSDQFRLLMQATASLKEWFKTTMTHVRIVKLEWTTHFSTGDAAWTAVFTGILWSIKATIVGKMSYGLRMKKNPKLAIVPEFKDVPDFTTEISCIAKIPLGYALYAGTILMYRVLKVKGGIKTWVRVYRKAKSATARSS